MRHIIISVSYCDQHDWYPPNQLDFSRVLHYSFVNQLRNFYAVECVDPLNKVKIEGKDLEVKFFTPYIWHAVEIFHSVMPQPYCWNF